MRVAAELGVAIAPLRLSTKAPSAGSGAGPPDARPESLVKVVAGEASPAGTFADAAVAVVDRLGLRWAVAGFDRAGRLSALTTTPAPSPEATARLGVFLAGPAGRAA